MSARIRKTRYIFIDDVTRTSNITMVVRRRVSVHIRMVPYGTVVALLSGDTREDEYAHGLFRIRYSSVS